MPLQKIGVIVAMQEELDTMAPFASQLTPLETIPYPHIHYHTEQSVEVVMICSGIGKVNAAIATTVLLQTWIPDLVINVGIAGGVLPQMKPGSVVLSQSSVYYDVDASVFGYQQGQIPRMPTHYESTININFDMEPFDFSLYQGMLCTGDSFLTSKEKLQPILKYFPHIQAIDMEAAAIAQTCYRFTRPFMSIKGITDNVDAAATRDSENNLALAMQNAAQTYHFLVENAQSYLIDLVTTHNPC